MAKKEAAFAADETRVALPAESPLAPSHIVLEADWGSYFAGKVLAADADIVSTLDIERVPWRAATEHEAKLGGFAEF